MPEIINFLYLRYLRIMKSIYLILNKLSKQLVFCRWFGLDFVLLPRWLQQYFNVKGQIL